METTESYSIYEEGRVIGVVQKGNDFDVRFIELLQEHFDISIDTKITPDDLNTDSFEVDHKHKFECIIDDSTITIELQRTWIY